MSTHADDPAAGTVQDDVFMWSVQTEALDASKSCSSGALRDDSAGIYLNDDFTSCSALTLQKDAMGTLVNDKERLPRTASAALPSEKRSPSETIIISDLECPALWH